MEDEMGRSCNMHGVKEMHTEFWLENQKGSKRNRVWGCGLVASSSG